LSEQAIIVDKNDTVLYFKDREDIAHDEIWRMVLVWLENSDGQVLMTRRAMTKKVFPGMWEPAAAGSVLPDESYEQAAIRELKEETGLASIALNYVATTHLHIPEHGQRMIGWYKGATDTPIKELVLEEGEVMAAKYFDKTELFDAYDAAPQNYPASGIFWRELFS
jgi:isopentenyldiphosphate isomerase